MSRNKSVNSTRTSIALRKYFEIAKQNNQVDALTEVGGFKTNAISIAISRGRISQSMIDTFATVLGANPDFLTGKLPLPNDINEIINDDDRMTDDEAIQSFTALIQTQNIGANSNAKKTAIKTIKRILYNF